MELCLPDLSEQVQLEHEGIEGPLEPRAEYFDYKWVLPSEGRHPTQATIFLSTHGGAGQGGSGR